MSYVTQLVNLMIEVMLPLTLLVAVGGLWPRFFPDTPVEGARSLLNRMVIYLFLPCILFSVASTTPISADLLSVPLLVGIGSLLAGAVLYAALYLTPRPEILSAAAVNLLAVPVIVWSAAKLLYIPMGEAQFAAVVEGTMPAMVTTLLLADRFRLDSCAGALLIGWTTILFWVTLPAIMALGLIQQGSG
jgi:predicted permease